MPPYLQLPMALNPRKGDAASVRRQSRQRLRSERRYTPYFGVCRFHGRLYGSEVRSRERHAAPLQWCTPFNDSRYELEVPSRDCHVGLRPPRNDNSEVHTVLTVARSYRQRCAGSGQPGPAAHFRPVPAIVKMARTNCVCSGGHCAAVGGFAALRMRRALYG